MAPYPSGYFTDGRRLFHAERLAGKEVVLENCKSGDPMIVPLSDFVRLRLKKVCDSVEPSVAGVDAR